jgi:hypothetical protein
MLVGSGGVVALVLGAWAVLWAVAAVPGASWRSWYPVVMAFGGAMLAFAMLTAQSELVLGLADWAQASRKSRDEVATALVSTAWRPLWAVGMALGATVLAAVLAGRSVPVSEVLRRPHWLERLISLGIVLLAVYEGTVWVALLRAFERAVSGEETLPLAAPKLQFLTLLGTAGCMGLLGMAGIIGLVRMIRSDRAE